MIQTTCGSRNDDNSDDDEEEFHDALGYPDDSRPLEMNLKWSLEESQLAICYFFNNKFVEAQRIVSPFINESMYHSVGNAVFAFMEAVLTFEQEHIMNASKQIKLCLEVCQRFKKRTNFGESIGKRFGKINYSNLTDIEAHAELCYAEALLLKALLTFIEDESLTNFIRGGMKIRQCFNIYKECSLILNQKLWDTADSRFHFESGVCIGLGAFNLMISLLPSSVIKILEFIGFSGNKELGIGDLKRGYGLPGLRKHLCAITLLGYHLIICYLVSSQGGDLEFCDNILKQQLEEYPRGVWFLFFKGRLEFMRGNLDTAIEYYKVSWKSQDIWPQFHHLSFWELLWLYCLKLDWKEAKIYASYLLENSKWSRTIYSYQKAVIMLMSDNVTESDQIEINHLMKDVPLYKQRLAGKSLPMEKFACKKANRYFEQQNYLSLAALELMYLWNTFKILSYSDENTKRVLSLIKHQKDQHKDLISDEHPFGYDNYALCLLLSGVLHRYSKNLDLALSELNECLMFSKNIKEDKYIIAYAHFEKSMIYLDQQDYVTAGSLLEECKKAHNGYSLESRLQFRIHNALAEIKEKLHSIN